MNEQTTEQTNQRVKELMNYSVI